MNNREWLPLTLMSVANESYQQVNKARQDGVNAIIKRSLASYHQVNLVKFS